MLLSSLAVARDMLQAWQGEYNEHRLYTALGNLAPKELAEKAMMGNMAV